MPAGDAYKVSIQGSGQGSIYMNVLALRQIGAVDLVQADFQTFSDGFKDALKAQQSTGITWRSWRAIQVFGPNVDYTVRPCERVGGFAFEGNLTGVLAGSDSQQALPPQSALVITLGSNLIGRRHRGRVYMWGLTEIAQDAGTWTSTVISALNTSFATWFNKYKEAGTDPKIQLGVWSERTAFGCEWQGLPPTHVQVDSPLPAQAFTPVSGYTIRGTVNTQRRRAVGVGR